MRLARVALLAALGCASSAPPPADPRVSQPALRAFAHVELIDANMEVGPPDRLVIDMDGAMRLVRTTNSAGAEPEAVGIGFFETRMRPDEVRALARALVGLEDFPDHYGRLVPDDHVRRVKVEWQGEQRPLERAVGTREPVDPRLEAILGRLEGLARRAVQRPRETVGLTLESIGPGAGGLLVARVVVKATGTWPIRVPGLRALLGSPGALTLQLASADRMVEVPVVDVTAGPPEDGLALEPGETASFDVVADPAAAGPAPQRAAVVMRLDGEPPGARIAGQVTSAWLPYSIGSSQP